MPIVTHTHKGLFVYCPLRKGVISVRDCYVCPRFIKRDGDRIYCTYEIGNLAGKVIEVLDKRDGVVVRTDVGIFKVHYVTTRKRIPKLEVIPYEVEQIREGPPSR